MSSSIFFKSCHTCVFTREPCITGFFTNAYRCQFVAAPAADPNSHLCTVRTSAPPSLRDHGLHVVILYPRTSCWWVFPWGQACIRLAPLQGGDFIGKQMWWLNADSFSGTVRVCRGIGTSRPSEQSHPLKSRPHFLSMLQLSAAAAAAQTTHWSAITSIKLCGAVGGCNFPVNWKKKRCIRGVMKSSFFLQQHKPSNHFAVAADVGHVSLLSLLRLNSRNLVVKTEWPLRPRQRGNTKRARERKTCQGHDGWVGGRAGASAQTPDKGRLCLWKPQTLSQRLQHPEPVLRWHKQPPSSNNSEQHRSKAPR